MPIKRVVRAPIYVIDKSIGLDLFVKMQENLAPHRDVAAVGIDEALWKLVQEDRIYCWFDPENTGDMGIGINLPSSRDVMLMRAR